MCAVHSFKKGDNGMKRTFSLLLVLITTVILVLGTIPAVAEQQTIEISVLINEQQRTGIYIGTIADGMPNGEGSFVSSDNKPAISYQGHWENGKLSGAGYLESEAYTVHFNNSSGKYDRTGQFKGEVYDGLPSGNGSFSSKNSAGIPWTYDGEWAKGQFEGYGKTVWYSDDGGSYEEGNYVNGEFTPTFGQLVGSYDPISSTVNEKSVSFIDNNSAIFAGREAIYSFSEDVNRSFDLAKFKKKPSAYSDKLIEVEDLQVIQVFAETYNNLVIEYVLMEDRDGVVYRGLFNGSTDLVEGTRLKSIWLLPIDWSTYKNIYETDIWSVYCAFTQNYEIMECITVTVTGVSVSLRDANGIPIASLAQGAMLDITGYDYSCNLFTATYGDLSGYVKGLGLSVSQDELYSYFK